MKKVTFNKTIRSIIGVATLTVAARGIGFLRELLVAYYWGAGAVSDGLVIAMNIPLVISGFVATAIGNAFIASAGEENFDKDNSFKNSLFLFLFIICIILSLLCLAFPKQVVRIFASGFDEERLQIAVQLTRYTVWTLAPIILAQLIASYLQLKGIFWIANCTGLFLNCFAILGFFIMGRDTGKLYLAGIMIVAGYILQLCVLMICTNHYNWRIRLQLGQNWNHYKEYLRLLGPMVLSSGVYEINNIIDKNFASNLQAGELTAINFASKVTGIVYTLFLSVSMVLFPKMSTFAQNREQIGATYKKGAKQIVGLGLPIMALTVLLAEPITRILFQRGQFTGADTKITAITLSIYGLELIVICLNPLLSKTFYALKDSKTPFVCSCLVVVCNILLNTTLIKRYGYKGLAMATVISDFFAMIFMRLILYCKYKILFQNRKVEYKDDRK